MGVPQEKCVMSGIFVAVRMLNLKSDHAQPFAQLASQTQTVQ